MIYVNEINDNLGFHIEVNTGGLCNRNISPFISINASWIFFIGRLNNIGDSDG